MKNAYFLNGRIPHTQSSKFIILHLMDACGNEKKEGENSCLCCARNEELIAEMEKLRQQFERVRFIFKNSPKQQWFLQYL